MTTRATTFVLLLVGAVAIAPTGCSKKPTPSVPGIDLSAYFVLPGPGYDKFFTNGLSRAWSKDTVVEGFTVVDVLLGSGEHDYFRKSDRAWVANLDTAGGGTLFLFQPPLAAIPASLVLNQPVAAQADIPLQVGSLPVRRFSKLVDTGLSLRVSTMDFDSVVLIRQEFWLLRSVPPVTDTMVDSAYRWFAPHVDEIRQVQWLNGKTDSTIFEFIGGTVGGNTYP